MTRRVSKVSSVIVDPQNGDPTIREEVFTPESVKHTSGTENYLDESQAYKPRASTAKNPF